MILNWWIFLLRGLVFSHFITYAQHRWDYSQVVLVSGLDLSRPSHYDLWRQCTTTCSHIERKKIRPIQQVHLNLLRQHELIHAFFNICNSCICGSPIFAVLPSILFWHWSVCILKRRITQFLWFRHRLSTTSLTIRSIITANSSNITVDGQTKYHDKKVTC